jgi:hypothetical protein
MLKIAAMAMGVSTFGFEVSSPDMWIQILPTTSTCIFLVTLDQLSCYDNWEFCCGQAICLNR